MCLIDSEVVVGTVSELGKRCAGEGGGNIYLIVCVCLYVMDDTVPTLKSCLIFNLKAVCEDSPTVTNLFLSGTAPLNAFSSPSRL